MSTVWEALDGMGVINVGVRRSGKPHNVMVMQLVVCMSESDAKLISKKHPALKFKKKTRALPRQSKSGGGT